MVQKSLDQQTLYPFKKWQKIQKDIFLYPIRFQYEEFNESENQNLEIIWYIFWAKLTETFREVKLTVDLLYIYIYIWILIWLIKFCNVKTNVMISLQRWNSALNFYSASGIKSTRARFGDPIAGLIMGLYWAIGDMNPLTMQQRRGFIWFQCFILGFHWILEIKEFWYHKLNLVVHCYE
jgi:hypothetical protein